MAEERVTQILGLIYDSWTRENSTTNTFFLKIMSVFLPEIIKLNRMDIRRVFSLRRKSTDGNEPKQLAVDCYIMSFSLAVPGVDIKVHVTIEPDTLDQKHQLLLVGFRVGSGNQNWHSLQKLNSVSSTYMLKMVAPSFISNCYK